MLSANDLNPDTQIWLEHNGQQTKIKVADFIIAIDRIRSGKNPVNYQTPIKSSKDIINAQETGYDDEVVVTYSDGSKETLRGQAAEIALKKFAEDDSYQY
jgi:hypothetical protein